MDKLFNWSSNTHQKDELKHEPLKQRNSHFIPTKTSSEPTNLQPLKPRKTSWFEGLHVLPMPTFSQGVDNHAQEDHIPAPTKASIKKTASE